MTKRDEPTVARILGLATAVPANTLTQRQIFDRYFRADFGMVPDAEKMFMNVGVEQRHLYFDPNKIQHGWRQTTAQRMRIWKKGTLELARNAVPALLERTGTAADQIGGLTVVSSTGYDIPAIDVLLARDYGMPASVRRAFIGHVGCHAAFEAIKFAVDSVAARPAERSVIFSSEICSAHFRSTDTSRTQVVSQALFGDGAAALMIGAGRPSDGPAILRSHTEARFDHAEYITWVINDDGFKLSLSPRLAPLISKCIAGFVDRLLAPLGLSLGDIAHWGIHPGGPNIIDVVGRELALDSAHIAISKGVLADYGNCSATTILLILDRILKERRPRVGDFCVLIGFGPGVTIEGLVLRF